MEPLGLVLTRHRITAAPMPEAPTQSPKPPAITEPPNKKRIVVCGATGIYPILGGAGDLDLELLESRTLDAGTVELVYRPTAH